MKRLALIAGCLSLIAGVTLSQAVFAQSAAIGERKNQFKAYGAVTSPVGKMLRGEEAFNLPKVQEALRLYSVHAKTLPGLFPDDSKTGGETKALPNIWENKARFNAIFAKLDTDATAALTTIKDEASFKSEMPKVVGNCGACHTDFRAK